MEIKSHRLDITQMPRDDGSFSALRAIMVKAFNYSRRYPRKMAALKAILKYTYTRISEFEKYEAELKVELEAAKKAEATKLAEEQAIAEKAAADQKLRMT